MSDLINETNVADALSQIPIGWPLSAEFKAELLDELKAKDNTIDKLKDTVSFLQHTLNKSQSDSPF